MRYLLAFLIFLAVVGAGLGRDAGKFFAKPTQTAAVAVARPATSPETSTYRTVRLDSDSRGHFQVEARVDGRRIDFMVDTGASRVVLNESSAAKVGIFVKPSDFTGRSHTANGVVKMAPVRLNRVEINGIVVHDVAAAVIADAALNENLLGMSFLSKVKFTHDRGRLILQQ